MTKRIFGRIIGYVKRAVLHHEAFFWALFAAFALAAISPAILAWAFPYGHDFLHVPFNAWFVLCLSGLMLILDAVAWTFWRRFCRANQDLADLQAQPLADEIPSVHGHKHLDQAEFLPILQVLFRRPPDVRHVRVEPLPGGYGGGRTVLAEVRRERDGAPLPRSFVVKLGHRGEMAGEHERFQEYVRWYLPRAARFFRYAEQEDWAGIAYEFVGLDPEHEIQNLAQVYRGHATVEILELIEEICSQLGRSWYRHGRQGLTDLYREYGLLSKKRERIIGHVGNIVAESDPYRANFTATEERLQPNLRPTFCPSVDMPWRDPVAFLRTWPRRSLALPVHRSVVHGDLHAGNVLVEIGEDGRKHPWFIDFSHTGNGLSGVRTAEAVRAGVSIDLESGHTLRDFCRLEADVKFILTRLYHEDDLGLAVAFERELVNGRMALGDWHAREPPFEIEILADEGLTSLQDDGRFKKAWRVVREIRRQAARYLVTAGDPRPYYAGLLHATLPIVYYDKGQFESEACERHQKRYALLAAGMLCDQL